MKTRRLSRGVPAILLLLSIPAPAAGRAAGLAAVSRIGPRDAARNAAYWTPARMAAATPLAGLGHPAIGAPAMPVATVPSARPSQGSRVVGALFFDDGYGKHYCTASVIYTPTRNLLITAAHCLYNPDVGAWNSHIVFVPKYSQGHRPYGTWPVWLTVTDRRWTDHGDPDVDFGFAAVRPVRGRRIADVVGANHLLIDQSYDNPVTVIGYPAKAHNPADRPIRCLTRTHRLADRQVRFDCRGFTSGTSGSPLILNYDDRSQSGFVIGVIGGYERGGVVDWRSYSATFGDEISDLIVSANDQAGSSGHSN